MPDLCSCGAQLLPDSRFCHKCGRPLRPGDLLPIEDEPEEQEPVVEFTPVIQAPPVPPPTQQGPSFSNPIAVRVAALSAVLAFLLTTLLSYGFLIWLVGAGFFAVWLFGRRTGQHLSVKAGARLGLITGVLNSLMITVIITMAVALGGDEFWQNYRTAMQQMNGPNVDEALQVIESPMGQLTMILLALVFSAAIISVFCTAGGAIGAKVLQKD